MTLSAAGKKARPMSPHLQVYRPQLTAVLSIFHRMTGFGLAAGLPVFSLWLVALALGGKFYDLFLFGAHSYIGKAVLMGWTWAFCYHLCTGLRHLVWDIGLGLDIKQVYKSGYIAFAVSGVLTLVLWGKLLWVLL